MMMMITLSGRLFSTQMVSLWLAEMQLNLLVLGRKGTEAFKQVGDRHGHHKDLNENCSQIIFVFRVTGQLCRNVKIQTQISEDLRKRHLSNQQVRILALF